MKQMGVWPDSGQTDEDDDEEDDDGWPV